MHKRMLVAGLALVVLGVSGVVVAGVPADKAEITINVMKNKKAAVVFPHAKHATLFKDANGKSLTCQTCHHTAKTEKDVKACTECHVMPGQAQKDFNGKKAPFLGEKKDNGSFKMKSILFHEKCLNCHKAVAKANPAKKSLKSCKTCHNKK